MAETKLRKFQYIPFLDVSGTFGSSSWNPSWKRIDRSTIFELSANPQTEEMDYISYELPVTEIDHYTPELPQEIALYAGNPVYEYAFELFYDLPVGSACFIPVMLCFAPNGEEGKKEQRAWQIQQTTFTLGALNTVEGKITFTLNFGGDIERGKYEIAAGIPTFTKGTYNNGSFSAET